MAGLGWAGLRWAAGWAAGWTGLGNWFLRKWKGCPDLNFRMANSNKQFLFISFLRV